MSIEQLLFFLLLIALPLLERLIRAMRTRTNDASGERDGRQTELTPPPALPQAVRHTVSEPLRPTEGAQHVRREGSRGPSARLRAGGRSDWRSAIAPVLVNDDLRRAIVLIAVLGPCRALEPKDASPLNR